MAKTVSHIGVVESIDANGVLVRIESAAACGTCHAKAGCAMSGVQEKLIQVRPGLQPLEVGEEVNVVMRQSLGTKAVMLAYVLPLVVLVASLLILFSVGLPEGVAGLLSLVMLAAFYVVLYLFRSKLDKEFSFNIEKKSNTLN
jgi:sigma-E factor negative regulatory protein RseC